ncbi:MAG TPA: glycosyltransferase family 4 protein [Candidatus Moranbacteria bacterium]|nr:glycosyltransferase family 4 protein [Candidatus Moranbacteria bacterium]
MKKILFLNHNQENFGTYYRCLFLGKNLAKRGHRITMLCASGKKFDLLVRRKKISENFTIITLPRIKYHEYFTGQIIFRLPLALFFVLFSHYDICHAFTVAQPQIAVPAWVAKVIRRKKLVIDWDDLWGGGFAEEHGGIISKVLGFSERYFLRFADRITYVSEFIGEQIEKVKLKTKKIKIPNGSNTEQISPLEKGKSRQKLGLKNEENYLVSIGNTYTDSLGLMLEAFRETLKKEKVKLIMVGEGKVTGKFKKLFDELKENIIVTGKRPFGEVPLYLSSANVLLLPMDDNGIEKARFPMRFGDYLCANRPIISNAVGEVEYYIKKYNCGLASSPASSQEFSQNISKALNDRNLSDTIGLNARKLAEGDLNWDNIGEKLEKEVYFKV